ncbi:MAG TPA: isochorismatase family cysteine hydrolase, partial [Chloroflexota bacterium]|nr:isochorismatase family cysteine hydrolase [Chloroflexota bacterium]
MKKDTPMDRLDPARTALVVVHMVKGVAGDVDTPFNRIFRRRAEEKGLMGVQKRLLDGFRTSKAKGTKVVYTAVTYQPGYPGVRPNSRLFRTLIDSGGSLLEGTPAVEIIDDLAPRPGEPLVRGQAASGFDRTELDSILRMAGVDTLVVAGISTDVAVESTARAAGDLQYRTIVVSDGCVADTDEGHANSLAVFKKWFGETPAAA